MKSLVCAKKGYVENFFKGSFFIFISMKLFKNRVFDLNKYK